MTPDPKAIDHIDRDILTILEQEGRISWRALADRVHLASTSVADRVRRLERLGVITGYTVRLDPAALGRPVRAMVEVQLPPGSDPSEFEAHLAQRPEIVFAAYVTGAADYTLMADCAGADGLDTLIRWLKGEAGAARTESKVMLRSIIG